jgi:hypothetical protein
MINQTIFSNFRDVLQEVKRNIKVYKSCYVLGFASLAVSVVFMSCTGKESASPVGGTKVEKSFELTNKISSLRFDRADSSLVITQTGVYSAYSVNSMTVLKLFASTKAQGDVVSVTSPLFNPENILGIADGLSTNSREVFQTSTKNGLTISAEGYDLAQSTDGKYRISRGSFDDNANVYAKNVESPQQLRDIFSNPNIKWKLQKNPDSYIRGIGTDDTTYLVGLIKQTSL